MSTQTNTNRYALRFHGSEGSCYRIPRHKVWHDTYEDAATEADRVNSIRGRSSSSAAACPALIIDHGEGS